MKSKRIKVAYILTPITFGGAEKVSLNFLRHVDRGRFDIKPILLTRPWEEEPYFARETQRLGYEYETVPVACRPRSNGRDRLRLPRIVYRFYCILKNKSFDVVHTHGYFADICALPVARSLGIRTHSTSHGYIAGDNKLRVYNVLDKYALRLCGRIIAVSDGIKDELVRSGIKQDKVTVIPNAVASSIGEDELLAGRHEKRLSLGIAPDDFVVGYLGRLSKEKGLHYLIQAIAELRDQMVTVKLLIVGDGPERHALEQMVKDKELDSCVIFAGFQDDIENWLSVFDVFVLPSLTEGTPMALLEAMATGVPVIATKVGGVPKVVNNQENGLLVPSGDHQAIINGLNMLKNNPELRARLAKAGTDTIKANYSVDMWCRKIEKVYSGDKLLTSKISLFVS